METLDGGTAAPAQVTAQPRRLPGVRSAAVWVRRERDATVRAVWTSLSGGWTAWAVPEDVPAYVGMCATHKPK
jgi:hypothetical protein